MQKKVKAETVTAEANGVRVTVNGALEVQEVELNEELDTREQAEAVKEAMNEANKTIQRTLATKFRGQMGM